MILRRALEYLNREKNKLRSINCFLIWCENQRASMTAPYRSSYFLQPWGWYCWKSNKKFNCAGCWVITAVEFTSWQIAHVEIRALTGKEGGPETWGGDVCGTQVKLVVSDSQVAVSTPCGLWQFSFQCLRRLFFLCLKLSDNLSGGRYPERRCPFPLRFTITSLSCH